MLRSVGLRERATEKSLTIEPSPVGVRVFLKNDALDERIHMDLTMDDMELAVRVLQERIIEIKQRKYFKEEQEASVLSPLQG